MFQPQLYWVEEILPYRLALTPRPRGGEELAGEVAKWRTEGVDAVMCLLETDEIEAFQLQAEAELCATEGIEFLWLPIVDRETPASMEEFAQRLQQSLAHLRSGRAVAVHCRAGIGRTGLVAACLLHLLGFPSGEILPLLSRARGLRVPEMPIQEEWFETFAHAVQATPEPCIKVSNVNYSDR